MFTLKFDLKQCDIVLSKEKLTTFLNILKKDFKV